MVEYRVCKGKNGYGIEAVENEASISRVEDLFDTQKDALDFAKLCTVLDLSPLHLKDVSEDILFMKKMF